MVLTTVLVAAPKMGQVLCGGVEVFASRHGMRFVIPSDLTGFPTDHTPGHTQLRSGRVPTMHTVVHRAKTHTVMVGKLPVGNQSLQRLVPAFRDHMPRAHRDHQHRQKQRQRDHPLGSALQRGAEHDDAKTRKLRYEMAEQQRTGDALHDPATMPGHHCTCLGV